MAIRKRPSILSKEGASAPSNSSLQTSAKKEFKPSSELSDVMKKFAKDYGVGTIRRGTDSVVNFGRLRTGILIVDIALGGGWRCSSGCMIYGERSAGKTTLALLSIKEAQRQFPDKAAVWIDVEGTLDLKWAEKLGVDLTRLLVIEPDSGEDAVDQADAMMRTEDVSMVVTDSIAFLSPMKEIEASAEDNQMALQARLVGRYIRRVNNAMLRERKRNHYPIVMHLNQFRMKIGVFFGDPRTLPGGKALEFSTSQQVLMTNKEILADKGDDKGIVLHNEHAFTVTKDKTGGRLKEGKFVLVRDESEGFPPGYINQTKTILTHANIAGLYTGGGTSHKLDGLGSFRTHDEIGKFFFENPKKQFDFMTRIVDFYRAKWDIS